MYCGIDPGRFKIGFALSDQGKLLFSAIIPKSEESTILHALKEGTWQLLEKWRTEGSTKDLFAKKPDRVFLGDGTSSGDIIILLNNMAIDFETVSEHGTTLEGRKRYWELHPPKGLWKLVPLSLRTPPRDIDDLAAWVIIKII